MLFFLISDTLNRFLHVITSRKTLQFNVVFMGRNNFQNETKEKTPSFQILMMAGILLRSDHTMNTQIFSHNPCT